MEGGGGARRTFWKERLRGTDFPFYGRGQEVPIPLFIFFRLNTLKGTAYVSAMDVFRLITVRGFKPLFQRLKWAPPSFFLWEGPSGRRTSLFLPNVKVNQVNHLKCRSVKHYCTNLGHWNKKTNIINWIETCWKSHLCGKLTTWLFTKRGGVESGTTKSQIHLMAGRRTWTRNIWIRIPAP